MSEDRKDIILCSEKIRQSNLKKDWNLSVRILNPSLRQRNGKGTPTLMIQKDITQVESRYVRYSPTYKHVKAIIEGLVKLNGKEEVEKELGVKICQNKR